MRRSCGRCIRLVTSGQKTDDRRQLLVVSGLKKVLSDEERAFYFCIGQKTEVRGQRTEDRGQKLTTED